MTDDTSSRYQAIVRMRTSIEFVAGQVQQSRDEHPDSQMMLFVMNPAPPKSDPAIIFPERYGVKPVRAIDCRVKQEGERHLLVSRGRLRRWCREMSRALDRELVALDTAQEVTS